MDREQLLSELEAVVGGDNLRTGTEAASVYGLPTCWEAKPLALVTPGSAAEIAEVVRAAERAGAALLPYGGGTQVQTGYPPRADKPYLLLSTARLHRVLDYQPDDLTVTCEPGLTLAALQEALATRHQFLPLDVPLPERATLGGIVSTNATGFWRPAYGAPRDLGIGLRAIMTGGTEVKGGGKVVKNVAGYDVCKLFTGAWGTLGMLTEITFKVRTLPKAERALAWDAPDLTTAARVGLALHHARLAATYLLATNELDGRPRLILGLQGTAARVDWQAAEFARLAAEAGLPAAPIRLAPEQITALRNRQARNDPDTPIAARISCLPAAVAEFVRTLETLPGLSLTAHCATGTVALAATNPVPSPVNIVNLLKEALPQGANLTWIRLDGDFPGRESIALWGVPREDFRLQRALKQSLDPKNTFSPGRFLAGL